MGKIMPIDELIDFCQDEIGNSHHWTDGDTETIIVALQQYRSIMSDALEVVSSKGEEVLGAMDEFNSRDDEDDTLTQCEQDSWIGLCEILGYDYPIEDWYREMWIDNSPEENEDE